MTKVEKLIALEIKSSLDELIKIYEIEIANKKKELEVIKRVRRKISTDLSNQEAIDRRLEELCNFKKDGETDG